MTDSSFTFDEITIKRMPHFLILMIILLLGLPYIGLNWGIDFGIHTGKINEGLENNLIESQVRGYFRQTLLQWSGFSLAAVTVLLAFTRYKLSDDKIALIIGLSILFSGSIEAIHTLFIDGLASNFHEKNNFDALIWTSSNSAGGLILLLGLSFLLKTKQQKRLSVAWFAVLSFITVLTALTTLLRLTDLSIMPNMWSKNDFISRPYEYIPILIYLSLAIGIYPLIYKKYPSILTHCIFYISITQIITAVYLMVLSHSPYDSAYNIAYFLKLVTYFIPCICLIINYIASYAKVLRVQTILKSKQEELQYMASHDSLTNLYNRREFEELLSKSIATASRSKLSLALLLIDVDNFKSTNDTFGHVHGDELLRQFSNRLTLLIRRGDIAARVGGDEFTLIAQGITSPSSARKLAERILNELNNPYLINDKLITVTASIGIAIYPTDGLTAEKLLIRSDLAMYKAKNSGKNTYYFYVDELSFLQHRESEIEAHLRNAIQHNELKLYFQPQYNLLTNTIIGAEILLRWDNETLGNPSPNEFIPVAERSGLIVEIGNWVLMKACEQIIAWKIEYPDISLSFSINISPIQLTHTHFIHALKKALAHFNDENHQLEFEITESTLMDQDIKEVLQTIAALGVKISLDDFGKGYSSLNRLKTFPIDTLKIDKDFISDIQNKSEKIIIVDIIIKLANELGMNIIAEGIETKEQLDYLISRECHYGQGFLLSKPLTIQDFTQLAFKK
ncbi:MAG: GGDEF-domain containing protein [Legionella sp.]|nr:MAG: GGDEF-domain containing protein [Legionella sp.]PJD99347.1 MAG: GGDEF-domain containing protein [Legionella sp.]